MQLNIIRILKIIIASLLLIVYTCIHYSFNFLILSR